MKKSTLLNEGVRYDENNDKFIYNFDDNVDECIIKFNLSDLVPIQIGLDEIYYFGYEFEMTDYVSSKIRTQFFNDLRYGGITKDKHKFILDALIKLHKQINIHKFDIIVYPESRSDINSYIIKLISRTTNIKNKIAIRLLEILPSDYFSITETVKKNKHKQYIYVDDSNLESVKTSKNILLIDDVNTTGATILSAIKSMRKVNQEAKIVVLSIIGKDFLQKIKKRI